MATPVRVLFVDEHSSSKQNGIGTFRDVLLPRLAAMPGVEVRLISLNSDYPEPTVTPLPYGAKEYSLPPLNGGRWREYGSEICRILRRKIRDSRRNVFVVNHSPCAAFIDELRRAYPRSKVVFVVHDQGWCASLLGSRRLLREIMVHDRLPDEVSEATAKFVREYCGWERDIYSRVERVVCLSESTLGLMDDVYATDPAKAILIPNGYHRPGPRRMSRVEARRRLGIRPDEELLVIVTRPARHKGAEAMLKAVAELRRRRPYLRCALIGSMKGFADFWDSGRQVASNLICTGQLSQRELRQWHAAANLGILPSYTEQCSFSALEMMCAGLPVVSSDGNGLCDMFADGENAFVAEIGTDVLDDDAYALRLADAIDRALGAPPAELRRHTAACRQALAGRYSADVMARRYADMLRDITGGGDCG